MRRLMQCGAVMLAMSLSAAALAGDWPQFRGPTGQGVSDAKGLPVTFDATTNVTWKREIPGEGWSSPIVYKGRLYLTSAVPDGAVMALRTMCLKADTGDGVWETNVFEENTSTSPRIHQKNSHASPTPLIDGDRLYVHFGHMGTACLDLEGKVIWRTRIDYRPVHGGGGSPIIVDGVMIFSCDGAKDPFVIGLDAKTGGELWRTPRNTTVNKPFSFSTPLAIEVNGKTQVISPGSGAVVAYEPKSGKEIWRARYGEGYSVVPRPVFGHGLVFVSSSFDRPKVLAIRPDGKGDVTDTHVAWELTRGAPHTPSMLLIGDEIYVFADNGTASCVDAKTGDVYWQERLGGAFSASPVLADGHIYISSEQGKTIVLQPGKTFKMLAENDLKERTLATLAAVDDAIYLRTKEHLYRIEKK